MSPERPQPLPGREEADDKASCDRMWRIISRFDTYYASTNTKGALLGAFAASVLGALLVKGDEIIAGAHTEVQALQRILIVVAELGAVGSLGCVMMAITPFHDASERASALSHLLR